MVGLDRRATLPSESSDIFPDLSWQSVVESAAPPPRSSPIVRVGYSGNFLQLRAVDSISLRRARGDLTLRKQTMTEEIVPALSETLDEEPAIRDAEAAVHHGTMAESQVEMAETELRRLGLRNARVQHFGELACVIVSPCDIPVIAVEPMRSEVVNLIQSAGFSVVALDMTGTPRSLR
jgi:hypothetical protein